MYGHTVNIAKGRYSTSGLAGQNKEGEICGLLDEQLDHIFANIDLLPGKVSLVHAYVSNKDDAKQVYTQVKKKYEDANVQMSVVGFLGLEKVEMRVENQVVDEML